MVRLRVSHPPNATSAERAAYNALQPKCLGQVLCNKPPKYFDIKVLGTPSVPVVEVLIQSKLVQLIPLLQDVAGNTATDGDGYSDLEVVEEREARLALPCSVWGLVSLLLLEEGNVDIEHWFEGPYTHPALHMQTLEVRFYWNFSLEPLAFTPVWILQLASRCNLLKLCGSPAPFSSIYTSALHRYCRLASISTYML